MNSFFELERAMVAGIVNAVIGLAFVFVLTWSVGQAAVTTVINIALALYVRAHVTPVAQLWRTMVSRSGFEAGST